ncbi:DUF1311 domain-containing protein [Novosphingobium sp. FSY-8]|uniref:DUF1311 domain-containing protein n=1 Tax=Novosphingobium ovatum TaxID=1908523 RepID=A0ABW9XCK9_9SPHN|nr:lysozyme inhibitor LprI family protein [Novosphingobium ovatum]NBC36265.1 DUF1311 domain-containing protein [Novosphingobium ovatum]
MWAALVLLAGGAAAAPALPPYGFGPILSLADPAPPPNRAIEARYTPAFVRCIGRADLSTITHNECLSAEMKVQDARLNAAWRVVFQRVGSARQPALRRAQRAWIAARDKHCLAQSKEAEGGSLEAIEYGGCMVDETIRRTLWLEGLR